VRVYIQKDRHKATSATHQSGGRDDVEDEVARRMHKRTHQQKDFSGTTRSE
jgi:hypothetical protein